MVKYLLIFIGICYPAVKWLHAKEKKNCMLNLLGDGLISWWCNHNVYPDFFQFDTTLLHEAVVLTDPSGKILFIVVS